MYFIQSSMEARPAMDFFQHRYYRLNKMFLKTVGLWPYQSIRTRLLIIAAIVCITVSQLVPMITAIANGFDDWDFIIECALPLIFIAFTDNKYISSLFNTKKLLKMLNHMRENWEVRTWDRDIEIFHKYAEEGRKMTVMCLVVSVTNFILFITQPVAPKIIDIMLRNGTEPGEFPIPVDYGIDEQKYYFYIILHFCVSGSLGFLVSSAYDAMFIVYVQHGCGLFAALRRKLDRIGDGGLSAGTGESGYVLDKHLFEQLSSCIDNHTNAIEYAALIESTYSWSFFFMVGCSMLLMSMSGIQIITKTVEPQQALRFIGATLGSMYHLYIISYMAQILMEHSISIRYHILNVNWYRQPLKVQKLLLLMLMRCNVPCKVTAGKIVVMSMESFGAFLRTSLSYFTLLRSV